ncbi:hypothetical protein ELS19_13615 [Halogeometricum borinquense]|uniref:Zn-finger containing protein n=1 Tax=Halogeometricum borinquense TaxID=60847 RepID=A0A482TNU0_9EURY|nr:Sjogren's syndrome/scleroderma autoantigen 1 family protein [Halogeometricum borinquense]RYJ14891.1 hypothetical protein ELS19_13615 [Halogeometricum borinquense]
MSDFDKEAERQRLREKYEKDTERRQETQRMSELLLQGATMSNKHCNECGTPIFRYQGAEFCPTCQDKQAKADAEQGEAANVANGQGADGQGVDGTTQTAETGEQADSESPAPEHAADASQSGNETAEAVTTPDATGVSKPTSPQRTPQSDSEMQTDSTETRRAATTSASGVSDASSASGASAQTARESLLEAITQHSRRATEIDEPRRAKQHLEAAREAAEALDALDR